MQYATVGYYMNILKSESMLFAVLKIFEKIPLTCNDYFVANILSA